jgi:hypothetical protein
MGSYMLMETRQGRARTESETIIHIGTLSQA